MRMEISTKECGKMIKLMVMAHTHIKMELNIKETGKTINSMV